MIANETPFHWSAKTATNMHINVCSDVFYTTGIHIGLLVPNLTSDPSPQYIVWFLPPEVNQQDSLTSSPSKN